MKLKFTLELVDDKDEILNYMKLLKGEDFNFRTKDINLSLLTEKNSLYLKSNVNSILDLKIVANAVIKSLEVIYKTKNINKNGK